MDFDTLHENLRLEILRRIDRGALTGSTLARATGFQQAHISNFLNRKRSLSLEGLDRVLVAQGISILDLLPADAIPAQSSRRPSGSLTQTVPVVSHSAAVGNARIQSFDVIDTVEVPDSIIHLSRQRVAPGKVLWQRFVAIRADGLNAAAMEPLVRQNSAVVIDRHYNSLALYRSEAATIYAVHTADTLYLTFLEFDVDTLILRPRNPHIPVRLIELGAKDQPGEHIVGRVCYILSEF